MNWINNIKPSTRILILTGAGISVAYIGYSIYQKIYNANNKEDEQPTDSFKKVESHGSPLQVKEANSWFLELDPGDPLPEENTDFQRLNAPQDEVNSGTWVTPTPSNGNLGVRLVQNAEEVFEPNSPRSNQGPVESETMEEDIEVDRKASRKILILGLENSGKSALLSQLSKEGTDCTKYTPTKGFNVVCISFEKVDLNIWEVGGSIEYRSYWKNFSQSTDLILFAVDSSNRVQFPIAKKYLNDIINEANEQSDFHIIATKSDLEGSASAKEIQMALGLDGMKINVIEVAVRTGGAPHSIGLDEVQKCCLLE